MRNLLSTPVVSKAIPGTVRGVGVADATTGDPAFVRGDDGTDGVTTDGDGLEDDGTDGELMDDSPDDDAYDASIGSGNPSPVGTDVVAATASPAPGGPGAAVVRCQ